MGLSNTNPQKTQAQGTGVSTDPDLVGLSAAAGYDQELKDAVLLSFDITPTVSGPLAFQYVFGSEEYPFFAPSPGEGTPHRQLCCCHVMHNQESWLLGLSWVHLQTPPGAGGLHLADAVTQLC